MRSPASCISPRACTAPPPIARPARSTIAPIGRCCSRARPPASSAPAASGSRSAGCAPRSACGSSAPAATPQPGEPLPAGFSEIGGAGDLDRFLPDSDFVVICCQWTPETDRLFNAERFAVMKPGSVLVNVARGEIVDEDALADALAARSSARRRARRLCRRVRAPAAGAAVVRSAGADHAACLGRQRPEPAWRASTCFATICAPISTAGRCAM